MLVNELEYKLQDRKLEPFDTLEILKLNFVLGASEILAGEFHHEEGGYQTSAACSEPKIKHIVKLWNILPESEPMRCHFPGFAIQTRLNGEVDFVASLCWKCNTITYAGRNVASPIGRTFDAESKDAKALLSYFQDMRFL